MICLLVEVLKTPCTENIFCKGPEAETSCYEQRATCGLEFGMLLSSKG